MENEFVIFHKFTDYETLKEFSELLTSLGIENKMQNNNHSYNFIFSLKEIDIPYGIDIRQKDFPKANKLLESYYRDQIPNIDPDYYIFKESNEELLKVLRQPYDFGKLDIVLAKYILSERGININEEDIEDSMASQLASEKKFVPLNKLKIFFGYILAIIFPFVGVIIGLSIYYNRKLLSDGERFYLYKPEDRRHGKFILIICILWVPVFLILAIAEKL